MQQAKPTMGCVMPSTAIPGAPASASMAQGTHLREASPPMSTNSCCSSTAPGAPAPPEPAQSKEGMVPASPEPSCRGASIFQRNMAEKEGETGQLGPKGLMFLQLHCAKAAVRCWASCPHLCRAGLALPSFLSLTANPALRSRAGGTWRSLWAPCSREAAIMEQLLWFWFLHMLSAPLASL